MPPVRCVWYVLQTGHKDGSTRRTCAVESRHVTGAWAASRGMYARRGSVSIGYNTRCQNAGVTTAHGHHTTESPQTLSHTHIRPQSHPLTYSNPHTHTHTVTLTHTYIRPQSPPYIHSKLTHTHIHYRAQTLSNTHTLTGLLTSTHTRSLSPTHSSSHPLILTLTHSL